MKTNWISFIPQFLAEEIKQSPEYSIPQHDHRFQTVALFADVSGFTQMSEALAQTGRRGAEELTTLLNRYFSDMIEIIRCYGGHVGKFGGDAMTILFPFSPKTQAATIRRAIQCALDMQHGMSAYTKLPTSVGNFQLQMKAGLAMGTAYSTSVGVQSIRIEFIVAGQVLDKCADAEHHANRGDVILHKDLLPFAGKHKGQSISHSFFKIYQLQRKASKKPLASPPLLPDHVNQSLQSYMHPSIAERLAMGQVGFVNEHRVVTVLFIRIQDFNYASDPHVGEQLQAYFLNVIQIVAKYDGYLNKIDMGDKGSKFIILFGAPVGHENDEQRAIRCALEIKGLPVPCQIGITSGSVFCGQVGAPTRQEYTVMGDSVNLAARLMQSASSNKILVDQATRKIAQQHFEWKTLAPIQVKGKRGRIAIFQPLRPRWLTFKRQQFRLAIIGRDSELARVQKVIKLVKAGSGQILSIFGENGVGKSRLVFAIHDLAQAKDFEIYSGRGHAFGKNESYLVWRSIFLDLLGVEAKAPVVQQRQQLKRQLMKIDPLNSRRLPLLGDVLNIPIPDNRLTKSLEPQLRLELTKTFLLDILAAFIQTRPLLLILEDAHLIDPLSQAVFEFLARNIGNLPLLMVTVTRTSAHRPNSLQLGKISNQTEIILPALNPADSATLILEKLKQLWPELSAFSETLCQQIQEKSQGNPSFIESIIYFLHEKEIDPAAESFTEQIAIPDSLHSLIISRIDRLSGGEQASLKVASIVGRLFKAFWLWESVPDLGQAGNGAWLFGKYTAARFD